MADNATLDTPTVDPAQVLAERFDKIEKSLAGLDGFNTKLDEMKSLIDENGKARAPAGQVDVNKSAPSASYSFQKVSRGLFARDVEKDKDWQRHCRYEVSINNQIAKAYGTNSDTMCPLSTELMRLEAHVVEKENGDKVEAPGVSMTLLKELQQNFSAPASFDPDEIQWMQRRGLLKGTIEKAANNMGTSTQGGTLVPLAAQGELIELLRNSLAFTRAGVRQFPLPPQGTIRYPRQTGANTVAGFAEAATITETELTTDSITLTAQAYSGLSKVTEDLIKFSSISVEALIREDLARQTMLAIDRDMFDGSGHGSNELPGLVGVSGITTRAASTLGANGDTLGTSDISFLIADMAEANAPIDNGVAIIVRPGLWTAVTKRKDSLGRYVFDDASRGVGQAPSIDGYPVIRATNVPNNRAKGSATDLTMILAIVPSEILFGMAGVIDMAQTNSDSTDFAKRIIALRCTTFCDLAVRHAVSVGLLDDLLAS